MPSKAQSKVSATGKPTITDIGIFPFKTYGSLIKRELQWFEDESNSRINSMLPIYNLAKLIAKDYEITDGEALDIVENLGEAENKEYAFKYMNELAEIQSKKYSSSNFDADVATMAICSRLKASSLSSISQDLFDYYDIEIDVEKGWQDKNTSDLPMQTIEDIVEFVMSERKRMTPEPEKTEPTEPVEDVPVTLGK